MRRAEHHSRALLTVVAAVVIAALIFAVALATFLPANQDTLRVNLGTIRTSIAEALTLARADDERRVGGSFFTTELGLLRDDMATTQRALAGSRPLPELKDRFAETAQIAATAADAMRALALPGARAESVIAGQATLVGLQARVQEMELELQRR